MNRHEDILNKVVEYLLRQQKIYETPNKGTITSYGRGARDAIAEMLDYIEYCKREKDGMDNAF